MHRLRTLLIATLTTLLTAGCWAAPAIDSEVVDAIGALSPDDAAAWTRDGRPKVAALEAHLARDISAADRDRAWDVYGIVAPHRTRIADLETRLADAERLVEAAQAAVRTAEAERAAEAAQAARAAETTAAALGEWRRRAQAAERAATSAARQAQEAGRAQAAAEAKARALLAGRPVCAAERAAVGAEIDVLFDDLDEAALALLACLAVGES